MAFLNGTDDEDCTGKNAAASIVSAAQHLMSKTGRKQIGLNEVMGVL